MYLGGTAFCNFWQINTTAQASSRAAWISLATMIPLLATGRLPVAMDVFQLSLLDVRAIHSATGYMATVQSALHVGLELAQNRLDLGDPVHFYGLLVS